MELGTQAALGRLFHAGHTQLLRVRPVRETLRRVV